MATDADILAVIADGHFHSGQELAIHLGLSRSAIWKGVQQLQSKGIDVYAVQGKGYRLANPIELLNSSSIYDAIGNINQNQGINIENVEIDVTWEVDSTNRYVMEKSSSGKKSGYVCLAETQMLGRGRRGRSWVSPLGGNIYFSQLWEFPGGPSQLSGLSLAVSLAVVRTIQKFGVYDVGLKWPNDILINGSKVAGILLEIVGESNGPTRVVVGMGINFRMPKDVVDKIDQPFTTLEQHVTRKVSRNAFVAHLILQLMMIYSQFERSGFSGFAAEWRDSDVYMDRKVTLSTGTSNLTGINRGVDNNGALLLEQNGQIRSYQSGGSQFAPILTIVFNLHLAEPRGIGLTNAGNST